ncbi:hypothetical protein NDU88_006157 [Pleurodeles waltl]|uniref:Uncharacterized protein n=1 Tax=Pleurodeles waltl TaxID=8319 RepID=A0AAV7TWZ7_PLEWA|nr:hypothetical protein NDU88_006157 [Pleurodeles waltl]
MSSRRFAGAGCACVRGFARRDAVRAVEKLVTALSKPSLGGAVKTGSARVTPRHAHGGTRSERSDRRIYSTSRNCSAPLWGRDRPKKLPPTSSRLPRHKMAAAKEQETSYSCGPRLRGYEGPMEVRSPTPSIEERK